MAKSKGNQKPTNESPKAEQKSKDENAKEKPLQGSGTKGTKEVDGKKDGKAVEAKKKSPRKNDKQAELDNKDEDPVLEQSNVELEEPKAEVPLPRKCASCNEVNRRWPPPPFVDPDPRDPTLIYPGDIDPEFQPARGDILVIHPGLHIGLTDLHRQLPKDGFVSCYDGSSSFEFALGDLVLRMGTYDTMDPKIEEPTKKESSKGRKGEKSLPKKKEETKSKGQEKGKKDEAKKEGFLKKGVGKKGGEEEDQKVAEKPAFFTYKPYEKLEIYTCSGFITAEEQAKLDAERLAIELEKERLANEAKGKGSKGKKDKKTKENSQVGGKEKPQDGDAKKMGGKGKKDGKAEAPTEKAGPKVPPTGKKGLEKHTISPNDKEPPNKDNTQDEILEDPEADTNPHPKPRWRYLGSQMPLDTKSQKLLEKQCPGLTYFYRRYMTAGTRCDIHSLTPILGEIVINIGWLNNWYTNLEKWQKEENKYRSIVQWYKPDHPNRGELVPGMILIRPLVGRENGLWAGWGLDGKKLPPPSLLAPLVPIEEENKPINELQAIDDGEIVPPPKCDCHRKSPCPKPPCPCHMYEPCPKLPDCHCVYCNPLPRKPKPPPPQESLIEDEVKDKKPGKGHAKDSKGKDKANKKDGKHDKEEKPTKGVKGNLKDGKNVKEKDKSKSKDINSPKDEAKDMKAKNKDGKNMSGKEDLNNDDMKEENEIPQKPYVWGAVEMYLFYGEEEGWEYWGRSDRICDTPYPLKSENAKPQFLHIDDRVKGEETPEENPGQGDEKTIEVEKDNLVKRPGEKTNKQGAKDDVNKKLEQGSTKKVKPKK